MEHMAFREETWIVHALESKAGSRDKLGYLITLPVKELLLQITQVFIAIQAVLSWRSLKIFAVISVPSSGTRRAYRRSLAV